MADQTGLVIAGDDEANVLSVYITDEGDGTRSVYNVITAGGGNDRVFGTDELGGTLPYGVQLFGEDGDDRIWDSTNADTLSGGNGNDVLYYAGGADVIDGGDGIDTLSFGETLPAGRISLDNLTIASIEVLVIDDGLNVGHFELNALDEIQVYSLANRPTLIFTEQAMLTDVKLVGKRAEWLLAGSDFNDRIDLSASTITSSIDGGLGNDFIIGGQLVGVIRGGAGNDRLTGGKAADGIAGGVGNDIISGAGGNDRYLNGEAGNDTVSGGDGNDKIDGGDGNDRIDGGTGNDLIYSSKGRDIVSGGDGDDKIFFGSKERLDTQILKGGNGDDTFENSGHGAHALGHAHIEIQGGKGMDTLLLRDGDLSDIAITGVEILNLSLTSKIAISADALEDVQRISGVEGSQLYITLSSGGTVTWDKGMANASWIDLQGSNQADYIDVSAAAGGFWTIDGGKGDDVIIGPSSRQLNVDLRGGDGNDTLVASGSGGVPMRGGRGNDILIGGTGNDRMDCSDGGVDTIIVGRNSGSDAVQGLIFSGRGQDMIDLSDILSVKNFEDLVNNHVSEYHDDKGHVLGTVIDLGGKNTLFVNGLGIADFEESSFIF